MKNKCFAQILTVSTLLFLTGCRANDAQSVNNGRNDINSAHLDTGVEKEENTEDINETEDAESESETIKPESEELLDAFLADEIPAFYEDGTATVMRSDLDGKDYESYSVGERMDLDNDGEEEQILNGPYGGMYFDARDGKVYVLAQGEGTAFWLSYTCYDDAVWIVHSDTTHAGRQMYWLTKYDGDGSVADEFQLSAEYWDSPDDGYDEDSTFIYRGEEISMEEYETLREEILEY